VARGAKTGGRTVDTPPIPGLPAGRLFRRGCNQMMTLGAAESPAAWDDLLAARERPDRRGGGTGLVGWFVRLAAAAWLLASA
jgi:hypothetical protein